MTVQRFRTLSATSEFSVPYSYVLTCSVKAKFHYAILVPDRSEAASWNLASRTI